MKSGTPDLDTWLSWGNRRRQMILDEIERRIEIHNGNPPLFDEDA